MPACLYVCVCVSTKSLLTCRRQQLGIPGKCLAALSGLCCSLCWLANISIIFSFRSMKCGLGIAMKFLLDLPKQQSQHRNGKQKRIYKSHPANTYKSKMLRYLWTFLLCFFFVCCSCWSGLFGFLSSVWGFWGIVKRMTHIWREIGEIAGTDCHCGRQNKKKGHSKIKS